MRPHFSLLTVFLLLSLYLLPSFNSSLQYLSTRKLYDEDSKKKVCSKKFIIEQVAPSKELVNFPLFVNPMIEAIITPK